MSKVLEAALFTLGCACQNAYLMVNLNMEGRKEGERGGGM